MKLSEEDKRDMLMDGQSPSRRNHFRAAPNDLFHSFAGYLAALDDLLALKAPPVARQSPIYTNIRL